jgi:3-hydroxyacyl-[acyl-carrier-protein] dehydratase
LRDDVNGCLLEVKKQDAGGLQARFCFPAELEVFKGHFPEHPLLPGALQVEMTRTALERALDCNLQITSIKKAKFLKEITPDQTIDLKIKFVNDGDSLKVNSEAFSGEARVCQLALVLKREVTT